MPNNIIDKIRVSGVTYDITGGNPTVEVTQAEYDALVTAGTVSADTYYIITDALGVDVTTTITSGSTNSQVPTAKAVYDSIPTTTSAVTSGSTDVLTSGGAYEQFGGLKLIKLTQSQYTALVTKDESTLYVVIPDPNP